MGILNTHLALILPYSRWPLVPTIVPILVLYFTVPASCGRGADGEVD